MHQEWRSRQKLDGSAIVKTALFVGAILFVMSGGGPWSTAGTMNAVMGRDLPIGMFGLLVGHFVVSLLYSGVIAVAIYRLRLGSAIVIGVGVALALYAANYVIFHAIPIHMQSPEGRAVFVHITFGLFASAAYKGMSVPAPFRGGREEVLEQTRELGEEDHIEDPEPTPADRETVHH